MSTQKRPILVVGSINMDLVASTPRIPRAGETLIGSDFTTTPGGKGANQAVAVARLGHPVQMIGAVGEDVFGEALLENLRAAGVGIEAVARVPGPSGVAPIIVASSGENSIVVVPGANGKVTPAMIDQHAERLRSAGMVLCQLELPLETVRHALALCAAAGVPVMLDPAPAADLPDTVWKQVTWFTPNETEAALYVGGSLGAKEAARKLLEKGVYGVVLKRGAEGSYVASAREEARRVKAFRVDAVDTVAAGDCFNGAFAVALLEGQDPWSAAHFASAAATISVTRRGAQASMPNRVEIDQLLAEHA
ncbi:MAG: ribokinase [Terracidiphilus sp.]